MLYCLLELQLTIKHIEPFTPLYKMPSVFSASARVILIAKGDYTNILDVLDLFCRCKNVSFGANGNNPACDSRVKLQLYSPKNMIFSFNEAYQKTVWFGHNIFIQGFCYCLFLDHSNASPMDVRQSTSQR